MSYTFKKDDYPSKMIDFVKAIYKRFKVLNKLSEKESNDFQKEVVTLLVDSNENIDEEIFQNILSDIGLEAFVLETLGNVIQRNPFKNQFELNRNLSTIAETLKKDQQQLQKRQKVLQRKEEKLKATEEQIISSVKQKILSFQSQSIQKIQKKQIQVKKTLTLLLNQIKTKQKVILQKSEAIKSNAKIVSQIDQREKSLIERIKTIEKRQKQLKGKDTEVSMMKKEGEIQQIKQTNDKLRENIKELNKRYKNLEMAYRKMKADAQKWQTRKQNEVQPQSEVKKCQIIPQINLRPNKLIEIDDLELSTIEPPFKTQTCEQMLNHINHQEIGIKFERTKRIIHQLLKSEKLSLNLTEAKQLKYLLNIEDDSYPNALSSEQQDSNEQSIQLQCLIHKHEPENDHESLLKQIRHVQFENEQQKLKLIEKNALINLTQRCMKINFPYQICEAIFELMIELIEEGQYYDHVIEHLGSSKIIVFLQQTYLNHETNSDIIQTATLLISRIKLHNPEIKLLPSFLRALEIRLKIESKTSFVYGNINSILR